MAKFPSTEFFPATQKCPHCKSEDTYAPGPRGEDPLFRGLDKSYYGWLICYNCGKVAEITYHKVKEL